MTVLSNPLAEYIVVLGYFVMMVVIGLVFRSFNRNVGDYFRSGSQGTWWIVGMSSFMSGVSALTFTGNGGAAFQAGWSILAIYLGNVAGLLLQVLVLAPWFRQMRATTFPEVVGERFGPITRQVYALLNTVSFTILAAIWLLALAIFISSAFGLPIQIIIPACGLIVLFYSTMGGKWAVLAADFVKGLLLLTMTVLLASICLGKLGGFSGMLRMIEARGLGEEFSLIKAAGQFSKDAYTWQWALAAFMTQLVTYSSVVNAAKYFAVKDGREARWAATLCCVLMGVGIIFWFIPPVTARLLFEAEVLGSGMPKPAEAGFAVVSLHFLPAGLIGLMVVAMFSATMSAMDVGMNANAAILVRDIMPAIFRVWGRPLPSAGAQLWLSRAVTLFFGGLIILTAEILLHQEGVGIFEIMINFSAIVGLPPIIPLVLCLFVRRVPPWSALASMGAAMIPSVASVLFPHAWNFQQRIFWIGVTGVSVFMLSRLFWRQTTEAYRNRVDGFFEKMHRPVNFAEEVGQENDGRQLLLMGRFTVAIALFVSFLLLLPNPFSGRMAILAVAMVMGSIGWGMCYASRRLRSSRERTGEQMPEILSQRSDA
jgi:SSS family solute:Na+ symporter